MRPPLIRLPLPFSQNPWRLTLSLTPFNFEVYNQSRHAPGSSLLPSCLAVSPEPQHWPHHLQLPARDVPILSLV